VKWALFMIGAKNAWKFNLLQMIKAKFVYAHVNIFYCPKEVVQRELIWITGIILAIPLYPLVLLDIHYLGTKLVIGHVKLLHLYQKH